MGSTLEGITLEFNNDTPIIELPGICRPSLYHYGSESNYQRFRFSYFIKINPPTDETIIYKYIISDVKYQPDKLYNSVDGMAGKCWVVTINNNEDDKIEKYYIRNWIDIVEYYKEKGLEFVQENK
jgi:hypothetical protein